MCAPSNNINGVFCVQPGQAACFRERMQYVIIICREIDDSTGTSFRPSYVQVTDGCTYDVVGVFLADDKNTIGSRLLQADQYPVTAFPQNTFFRGVFATNGFFQLCQCQTTRKDGSDEW